MKKITIYTDGSCLGNPGPGGWGAILLHNGEEKEISGANKATTNNQMEMQAAIEALKTLKEPFEISLYTDSKYLKDGITSWIHGWKRNNWKNAKKEPVKNKELWLILDSLVQDHKITWNWVKAHAGNELNERVDDLARMQAESL